MRSGDHPPPPRPAAIDLAAAVLVFGGLLGFSQLALGEYVVTGSLPAKGPIIGVATIAYAASIALGVVVRVGRAWLLAVNLAVLVAILYLPAADRPLPLVLALLHGLAGAVLVAQRRWFADVAAWRNGARDLSG
ncbi:MAG: hypothetical protein EPO36_01520 [Chloroflexota bacterium]|nr:MAG: hypothetical protein EPO36_01520 [Chloroflexota bacterium]